MQMVITLLVAVLGSSGVASVVVALLQHRWSRDARIDALVEAQQVLMIDRVRYLGMTYINAGNITLADKENLASMYKAYKALGGNGHLETIMSEVERLEVRG